MPNEFGFNIPKYLEFSAEDIERNNREQSALRASHSKRRLSKAESYIDAYRRQAVLSRTNLINLAGSSNRDAIETEMNTLAECLMYLGEFDEALAACCDPVKEQRIGKMKHAVERDDTEKCRCAGVLHKHAKGNLTLQVRFGFDHVYSQKHGRIVKVIKCALCDHWNAGGEEDKRPDDSMYRDPSIAQKVATIPRRK